MKSIFKQETLTIGFLKLVIVGVLFCLATVAHAASLSLSPSTGVYTAGQTFTARVSINTNGAPINAADGTLSFNPKEIAVVSVSKGSIFNLWTAEPSFSNAKGSISFSGGSPTGYTGSGGTVLSVTFRAASAGSPKVSFSSGSVLAADGKGTNVLTVMNGGTFTIAAAGVGSSPSPEVIEYVAPANTPATPVVQSSTHADQTKWYRAKTAEVSWSVPSDVTALRTLLDTKPTSIPTKVYDSPIRSLTLLDLAEGVQYFHVQFRNKDGWGKVAHFKLSIDTEKPSLFTIALKAGADLSNPVQTLLLETKDASSKIQRFMVTLDGKDAYEFIDAQGSSTLQLPSLLPGYHTVIIEAFDQANNSVISTFSFTILAFDKPMFTEYPREINEQVIPVIKGVTRPKSKVQVSLLQLGVGVSSVSASKALEVVSDDQGQFIFIPDGKLSLGVYELTAIAVDQYGAQSAVSDPIRIAVQQPGYLKIGSLVVSILSILIPLLALSALLILGLIFFFRKFRVLKLGVRKEAKEAELMLAKEFALVNDRLTQERKTLEAGRKTNKLTKLESELFVTLQSVLTDAQKRITKEIVDVEELVD